MIWIYVLSLFPQPIREYTRIIRILSSDVRHAQSSYTAHKSSLLYYYIRIYVYTYTQSRRKYHRTRIRGDDGRKTEFPFLSTIRSNTHVFSSVDHECVGCVSRCVCNDGGVHGVYYYIVMHVW